MYWSSDDKEAAQAAQSRRAVIPAGLGVVLVLGALVLTAAGAFAAGYIAANANQPNSAALAVFNEAWDLVNREFYYEKPSETDRAHGAIQGFLTTLKDPHTLFLPPITAARDMQVLRGEMGGIGAIVTQLEGNQLALLSVKIGWPAEQAGLKAGDILLTVDGKPVEGLTLAAAVDMIRGPLNTQVTITVKRPNEVEPLTFTVTRAQINTLGEMLDDNIAYISLAQFTATAPKELDEQLQKLLAQSPRALIFDLRDNGGGLLNESIQIADLFLTEGLVATEKTTHGETRRFTSRTGERGEAIPLVVLVNGNSASASEIVAGALRDRDRAPLIGQRTFGKGSVQVLFTLSDGSQLRVTQGAWYTPNETPIQSKPDEPGGLMPDVVVGPPQQPTPGVDPILQAAVEYIKKHY